MLQIAWSTDIPKARMKLYVSMLADINPVTLEQAVANLIKRSKFLPSIAEIREECSALSAYVNAHEELPTAQDAWEEVRKVASSFGYEKGLNELEGITRLAAKTIWRFFDPRNCQSYNESAAMSQFCKAYEQLVKREEKRIEIAESIKNNGLLSEARKRAELNMPPQTEVKMLDNGHLVEVERFEPIDLKGLVEKADIAEEYKAKILGVLK